MKYAVKTRNWNCNRSVAVALNIAAKISGATCYPVEDHDNKYYLETDKPLQAWAAWLLFMALRPLSGGWTYIVCPGHDVDHQYKAIYR